MDAGPGGTGNPPRQASSAFGASAFGQSAFGRPVSAFTTTPTSSPPRRNAFGALMEAEQPSSTFEQGQTKPAAQLPSSFSSPSPFGPSMSSSQSSNGLNVTAAEFKPGSAPTMTSNPFGSTSAFSRPFPPPSTTSAGATGSLSTSSFGTSRSAFSTTGTSPFFSQPFTSAFSESPAKSVFATSVFGPSESNTHQTEDTKSAFVSDGNATNWLKQASQNLAPNSASNRNGEYVSTSRLRFKHRPRWKTHDTPTTASISLPLSPKHVPPYRIPQNIQREIDQGNFATDNRFPGNRFLELKALRPSMRAHSIKHKLISDPEHRTDLTGAITVVGTCMDMCPEYERHEREFQKDVDDWEKIPGTNPKRIDHARAVKKYRRSAAGNDEPLESDLRPPGVLKMTLDYLFYELLDKHGLEATYAFIRDRTRAIRTDFTIQHEKGPIAVECFERIARFHILALHRFCERDDVRGFDYWQEVEQMMKTLQSLMQFYDDNEGKLDSPNEAEFRSYYILAHIRDTNSIRRLQALAPSIFLDPVLQTAIEFRSYAQRNTHVERRSGHRAAKLKFRNSEACQNAFTRLFKRVKNEGTSYLMACLLEYHFGGVRKGAIHSLWKAYTARHRPLPTIDLMEMLGMDDEAKTQEVARRFGMELVGENGETGGTAAVQLNKNSKFDYANQMSQRHSLTLVESKREQFSDVNIVDGHFTKAHETWRSSLVESPVEVSNQVTRKPSFSFANSSFPHSASAPVSSPSVFGTSSISPVAPAAGWNIFKQQSTPQNAFSISNTTALPQTMNTSQSTASFTPSMIKVPDSLPAPAPAPAVVSAPWSSSVYAIAPSPTEPIILPSRTESVFTPPVWTGQEDQRARARKPSLHTEVPESTTPPPVITEALEFSAPELGVTTGTSLPDIPRVLSPPRPTQEELLYEQKQAFLRASALARAKADRHLRFKILFTIFTHWKRSVMNRGLARALREDQEARFRSSIRNMGLSTNSPASNTKGKQTEAYVEEDLVAWEDTSQASSSMRRRPRKSAKRADDDATLAAIKEAETARIKLWEPGTFLSSVIQQIKDQLPHPASSLPHGWQVWLSTSPNNANTTEWLRIKFAADTSTMSAVTPGLNQIVLSSPTEGRSVHSSHPCAGLVVFDLSTSVNERALQSDRQRLLKLVSLFSSNRRYSPSILLLCWTEFADLLDQMSSLLSELQRDKIIHAWQILSFSNDSQPFDDQFLTGIRQLPLDTVGNSKAMSIDDVYQLYFLPWDLALSQGISICQRSRSDDFDWVLYGKVLAVLVNYLNRLAVEVLRTCKVKSQVEPFPNFDESSVFDRKSAFESLIKYLNMGWMASNHDTSLLRIELSSDLTADREFYTRAIPERLAHAMLHKIRESVPSRSSFFLHTGMPLPSVTSFTGAINSSLVQLEHCLPSSFSKKRIASGEIENFYSSQQSISEVKRRKHDACLTVVKPMTFGSSGPNGHMPRQTTLDHLKDTVAKARRSIENMRLRRDADNSVSPFDGDSDAGSAARDLSPEHLSTQNGRGINNGGPPLFPTQADIELPLIPPDTFEVIHAKPENALISPELHQLASPRSKKATYINPLLRFHPYLGARGRDPPSTKFASSPPRVRGAASLTPRWPESEGKSSVGNLTQLKESLQCARRAIEESRRSREASEEV